MRLFFVLILIFACNFCFSKSELVRYYCGELNSCNFCAQYFKDNIAFHVSSSEYDCVYKNITDRQLNGHLVLYIKPFQNILKYAENRSLIAPGETFFLISGDNISDHIEKIAIAKTRPRGSRNIVLLNLNEDRHWKSINNVKKADCAWKSKKSCVVWRGASTGAIAYDRNPRYQLVKNWADVREPIWDIGFNLLVDQSPERNFLDGISPKWVKGTYSQKEFLRNKYVLSVEGNDKDSGLQWKLFSNSVVLMPEPTVESWLREFQLEPYVHFVPVRADFTDLREKFEWCESNQQQCQEIAANATAWIQAFLDAKPDELELQAKILQRTSELMKLRSKNFLENRSSLEMP